MTSRSNPDWLDELIAQEGDPQLIDADERESLIAAIASANSPEPLDPRRHQQLLDAALGKTEDPLAPPSEQELIDATAVMRDPLVACLQATNSPSELSPEKERALRLAAVGRRRAPLRHLNPGATASIWGALAAAAIAVLWIATRTPIGVDGRYVNARPQVNMLPVRSTGSMFTESFANGTASERIDRIAQARQKDLRENRYLLWGLP